MFDGCCLYFLGVGNKKKGGEKERKSEKGQTNLHADRRKKKNQPESVDT